MYGTLHHVVHQHKHYNLLLRSVARGRPDPSRILKRWAGRRTKKMSTVCKSMQDSVPRMPAWLLWPPRWVLTTLWQLWQWPIHAPISPGHTGNRFGRTKILPLAVFRSFLRPTAVALTKRGPPLMTKRRRNVCAPSVDTSQHPNDAPMRL